MRVMRRLRGLFGRDGRTLATALAVGIGLVCCGSAGAPARARAVEPSPPPGAPAVESAPSSLVGLDPELPPSVIASSAVPGSHWAQEKAVYGTASTNDIAIKGAGGTTIRVDEIYPTTASGAAAKGPFPVLLTMTPYRKGQGGSSSPGSAASPGGASATGGPDNYLTQRGYIEVVEDVRGTGDSNGSWGLFDPAQQQDAIKVLNWAARLPHSDGRVGTYGPSYLGIDQLLLAGAVGPHSPLKAIFPMVSANDIYRDTSFMGGLLDFEFSETYLGLTGGLNTANPITDTASDPTMLTDLAEHRGRPRQRPRHLPRGNHREHPQRRRRGVRRLLLAGPQPAEHPRACGGQPHPRLPHRRGVRHLPERRAAQLRRAAERLGRARRDRADAARTTHDRALPADRRPLGAPQRLLGRRRPARARVVRHVAQARAHRHGRDTARRCTTTTSAAGSSTRPRRTRSRAPPRLVSTSARVGP